MQHRKARNGGTAFFEKKATEAGKDGAMTTK
jgi:hypothetical protein